MRVKCYNCDWEGPEDELDFNEHDEPEWCPVCGKSEYLMDRIIVGTYPICNTAAVVVYAMDDYCDNVIAGINDDDPEECHCGYDDNDRYGFYLDKMFVPFDEVMRV